MADRDFLTLKYKTAGFETLTYGERVEKVQVFFNGYTVDVEVAQDNCVDIDITYPDGEKLTVESILRKNDG